MKKLINIAIWTVLTTGLVVMLSFSAVRHKKTVCEKIDISIKYDNADTFLILKNIEKEIFSSGDSITGKCLEEINTRSIEEMLRKNPYIKEVNVYSTVEGNIKIKILQRTPIVRVINKNNKGFYIDSEGRLMPLKKHSTARIMVANGNIAESCSSEINLSQNKTDSENPGSQNIQNIYSLAKYINNDSFLKLMIDQVYINMDNEIELVPKVGNHLIFFGNIDDMEEKFMKLKALYKDGFSKTGWNKYKTINLKYKNQVVCSKK